MTVFGVKGWFTGVRRETENYESGWGFHRRTTHVDTHCRGHCDRRLVTSESVLSTFPEEKVVKIRTLVREIRSSQGSDLLSSVLAEPPFPSSLSFRSTSHHTIPDLFVRFLQNESSCMYIVIPLIVFTPVTVLRHGTTLIVG